MSYADQHSAIRARFNTAWGSRTPIAWPNVAFTPPTSASWVRFYLEDAGANQQSMGDPGNNVYRHNGVVTVMIFSPVNTGEKEALALADHATAVYRGWTGSGLRFRRPPFVRQIGPDRKWYHLNVLCPFERDSFF